ncbi:MAG: Ig-like domain-containing protein, partial [Nanoarchaeota archaeon]
MERARSQSAAAKDFIRELREKIRTARERRDYFVRYLKELWLGYQKGKVSKKTCLETEYRLFDGKTLREWIIHYDNYIKECERLIEKYQKSLVKGHLLAVFISAAIIGLLAFSLYYIQPRFSGFFVQEQTPEITGETNATISTQQAQAVLGQPVRWTKTVSLDEPSGTRVILPAEATNITVKKTAEIAESYSESAGALQPFTQTSPFQEEPLHSEAKTEKAAFTITGAAISSEKDGGFFSMFLGNLGRMTGGAIGTQPEKITSVEIQDNATSYEIAYETPAPTAEEQDIERGKRVKITSPENVHYENVLSFASLDESFNIKNPSQIRIHWIENDAYIDPISVQDRDNNGIYDFVEWLAPSLSTQTFEIIVIIKAEHLDRNRNFISDIYQEVKELDESWSEEVNDKEYVRVTFEIPLDSTRDITIYPRVVSGSPKIEVYEKDKSELIAEFKVLTSNDYNKIFLDGSSGAGLPNGYSQDVFDLKISGGSAEFDHIIDPIISGNSSVSIDMIPLSNNTLLMARINSSSANVTHNMLSFSTIFANGTIRQGPFFKYTGAGSISTVSVSAINSTHFHLKWYDFFLSDALTATYDMNGTLLSGITNVETSSLQFYDNCLAGYGNRTAIGWIDSAEGDFDAVWVTDNSSTTPFVAETAIDATMVPTTNRTNTADCHAINSTVAVFAWVNYTGTDNIRASIRDFAASALTSEGGLNNVFDMNVGTTGSVAVTALDLDKFAVAWYDGTDQDISMQVKWKNGTNVSTSIDVNTTAGTGNAIDIATIDNRSGFGVGNDNIVVVWYGQATNDIMGATFNAWGDRLTNDFVIESSPNSSTLYKEISVIGKDTAKNMSLCPDTFAVAYSNSTGSTLIKTYFVNGSTWDGSTGCAWRAPVADASNPVAEIGTNLADNANRSNSSVTFDLRGYDNALSAIALYGNWTGSWIANQTNFTPINATYWNITVDAIPQGKWRWAAWANDTTGNSAFSTTNRTFTIDTVAPVITLPFYVNATKKTSTSDTITLNISVTDATTNPSACKIDINGTNQTVTVSSGWCNITNGFLTGLSDGNRTINVHVNDSTGQFGLNNSFVVFVDAVAPVAQFGTNLADNANRSNSSVTFDLRGFDGIFLDDIALYGNWTGSWIANQTNFTPINATYWNITVDAIPQGKWRWAAWANDSHNNQAFSTTNRTFTIDTVAPVITLPFYANGTLKKNTEALTLNISVSDTTTNPSACNIDINGTNQTVTVSSGWCNITNGFLTNLADGNRTINVHVNDSTGQFGLNNSFVVKIDSTAPVIALPFYANGTLKKNTETLTLNISVSDAGTAVSACNIDINGTNQTVTVSSG